MTQTIADILNGNQILIADGATGTFLMEAGLPAGTPPESWNLEQPDKVVELHKAYINAGSNIILTNTFGGSQIKLSKFGYGDRVREINRAASILAKNAADGNVFVAGDIGPTGEMMEPFGPLSYDQALDVYAEQSQALLEGGADLLWVETMSDVEEARAAVTAARQATALPVFCSLSFGGKGRTMMGLSAHKAAEELWSLGLDAIGANCGIGLDPVEEALKQMAEALPGVPLIAKPNAGLPSLVDGQTFYDTPPEAFAQRIKEFVAAGARIVGACCGSNPEFIAAIREILANT